MSRDERQSQRRTILRDSPVAGGLGPTQTHLYMDGTKLMAQQYDGTATTVIDLAHGQISPVGTINQFGGSSAPSGWLACDGGHFNSVGIYADLASVLGWQYGRTDSSGADDASGTYFKVPDLRGRVPIHKDASDTDFDTLGESGGAKDSAVAPHTHGLSSTSQGAGYLEAVEHSVWDIPDWTLDNRNEGTSGTTMAYAGQSAWGFEASTVRDETGYENVGSLAWLINDGGGTRSRPNNALDAKYYNQNWMETWVRTWGKAEGSTGGQADAGEDFTLAANNSGTSHYSSRPHVLHTHADPDKNNTFKVQGEITNAGTGIDDGATGTGANMVPYVVVNSIIRYA